MAFHDTKKNNGYSFLFIKFFCLTCLGAFVRTRCSAMRMKPGFLYSELYAYLADKKTAIPVYMTLTQTEFMLMCIVQNLVLDRLR